MQTTPREPASTAARAPIPRHGPSLGLLALVFVGFISLGLPDGLLGVAWPSIRRGFGLPLDAIGALFISATAGYTLASLSNGWIVEKIGVGKLLALSSFLTALGLIGYALAPGWAVMVALGLVAGLGAGAIDAGLNAYVALQHSPRLLSWLHACFGLGAAAGPAIMLMVLEAGQPWQLGYVIVGAGQLVLGTCFVLTLSQWQTARPTDPASESGPLPPSPSPATRERGSPGVTEPGSHRTVDSWLVGLSVLLFFVYTGVETAVGQWSYTLFVEGRGVAPQAAGLWVSLYWGALAIGRVLSGIVANRLSPTTLIRIGVLGCLVGALLIWLNLAEALNLVGLTLMGLSAAGIFPSLIAVTPERVGRERAPRVIGYEVAAASLGIGGVPALAGVLAARLGLEVIPILIVVATAGLLALHETVVRLSPRSAE